MLKYILLLSLSCALAFALLIVFIVKSNQVDRLLTHYPYYDEDKKTYLLGPSKPPNWVAAHNVGKYARWAIVISEDWAFYDHPGVDLNQLRLALKESLNAGELTRGASTITQQVIKNTILSDERTLWRKFQEVTLALYLERIADKDRILEIYLNIVELGDGIYGISEASHYYFSKPPSSLNAREGAFIAMLLPSPVKYAVSFYEKELTEYAEEQIESILVKLRQADVYDESERLRQAKKRFYWEKDFYQGPSGADESSGDRPSGYDDYLEDSFL